MNKASGGDRIPVELFQILKDDVVKVPNSICSKFGKFSSGHRNGKGHFSFQSQRKPMPNNVQVQFSSGQSLSRIWLFATPWISAHQASLSITISQSSPRLTSIESVMPSSHLILCHHLLLLPPILPSIRVFSNESTLRMRWPKYWSFSFSIIPSKEIPGLISFRMDWLDLLAGLSLGRWIREREEGFRGEKVGNSQQTWWRGNGVWVCRVPAGQRWDPTGGWWSAPHCGPRQHIRVSLFLFFFFFFFWSLSYPGAGAGVERAKSCSPWGWTCGLVPCTHSHWKN